jgi:hypothetical protein
MKEFEPIIAPFIASIIPFCDFSICIGMEIKANSTCKQSTIAGFEVNFSHDDTK